MKNVIFKTKYVLLALVMVFIFSCAEDGAVGPQGATGAAGVDGQDGTDGADGQDGTDGADGQDGNANVMSFDWFIPPSYTLTTGFGDIRLLDYDHAATEITQEIIDTGVVLVYGKLNGYNQSIWPNNQVSLMPIVLMYDMDPVEIDTWTAILSVGNIRIRFINSNNRYNTVNITHQFRYVIIPSSGSTSGRIADFTRVTLENDLAELGVDINSYDQVAAYYGL